MTETKSTPLKYLDKALGVLRNLGLIKSEPKPAPIVALIDRIAHLEPDQAAAIARTLSQASLFNEVVREQIKAMQIAQRYREITSAFDSIRDDAQAHGRSDGRRQDRHVRAVVEYLDEDHAWRHSEALRQDQGYVSRSCRRHARSNPA